jgi:outer membrane protein assembly factor BamB
MAYRSFALAACVLGFGAVAAEAADVLMQHNDKARTGANLEETALGTADVGSGRFGKLWTLYADGQVVAQPLYVAGLAIDTSGNPNAPPVAGTFNAVVIATMHNTVYVYDADRENPGPDGRTVPLWATWLGKPRGGGKDIDMWSTNDPEWGILGTPAVSPDKATLYVVAWHDDGAAGLRFRLHALDMRNGTQRRAPVTIGHSSKEGAQPCKKQNAFNPCLHKQRAALLLDRGVLYVAFGGDGNRGALYAFDAATFAERAFWSSTPTGKDGGIWQSGQAPAVDADGNLYLATGNGSFDANSGGRNFGNSVVKLRLDGQGFVVADSFTPCNVAFLNDLDLDLGSGGVVLLPGTPARLLAGGKQGMLYLLSPGGMGGFAASPTAPDCKNPNAVQELRAFGTTQHDGQTHWGNIHGSPVYWNGPGGARIYVWGENGPLKSYGYAQGRLQDVDHPQKSAYVPPPGMPGGMLSLSADGGKAGSGVLWALVPLDGDANTQRGVTGLLLAFDAEDVTRTLWTSEQSAARDRVGLFAKFAPPTVAGGKVFVPTYGDAEPKGTYNPGIRPTAFPHRYYVAVYGLRPGPPVERTVVNQDRDDVAVVRATTAALGLDLSRCAPIDAVSFDCTAEMARRFGAPSFHRVVLARGQNLGACALVRVRVAGKNAGVADSEGIGFWSSYALAGNQAAENSGRFTPKQALKPVGTGTLLSGERATLYEFVGVANCPASGAENAIRLFKPYMEFEAPDTLALYRNWDRAQNYAIGGAVAQFDRSGDVLRP